MDIAVKIRKGTQQFSTDLCPSCRSSIIWEDDAGEHRICEAPSWQPFRPAGRVYRCNEYDNSSLPSRSDFERIAWELKTDKSGKVIGFKPPEKQPE